jgi:acyl-CoA thioesterase-2
MELSVHREEKGFEHEAELDVAVPDPDELLSLLELAARHPQLVTDSEALMQQQSMVELKPVSPEDFFLRKATQARGLYWIKASTPLPDEPLTQMAALAYLSDYFLMSTSILKHTVSMVSAPIMLASLDHAMWFHRPCRADDWVLVDAVSPFAGGARGFTRGQMYDRQRRLVASVAQEGLVRPMTK